MTPARVRWLGGLLREELRRRIVAPEGFSPDFECVCAIASAAMTKLLTARREKALFVSGEYVVKKEVPSLQRWSERTYDHCWVEWDGHVVDLTRTQFAPTSDPCAILKLGSPHYRKKLTGEAALQDIQHPEDGWPWEQRPVTFQDRIEDAVQTVLRATGRSRLRAAA